VSFEYFLIKVPNDYSYKRHYLDQNSAQIENLILGPSHIFCAVAPEYIDGHTFNASVGGQPLEYDYKIFNKYKDQFINLKTIVLGISYPSFWYKLDDHERGFSLSFNYRKYYNFDSDLKDFSLYNLEVFNRPLRINYGILKQYYFKKQPIKLSKKYGWNENNAKKDVFISGQRQAERQTLNSVFSDRNKDILNQNVKLIESMIQWSKTNNVQVVLVTTPMHEEFRKRINKDQLQLMINTAAAIANDHTNTFYYNFFEDDRFIEQDFGDATHLRSSGAIKFSKILNEKLKTLD
jgi:hypothetical protein